MRMEIWIDRREGGPRRARPALAALALAVAAAMACLALVGYALREAWAAAPLACALAVPALYIAGRSAWSEMRSKNRTNIKMSEVRRCASRTREAVRYLPNRYSNLVREIVPATREDRRAGLVLLREMAASLVSLGAYELTGEAREARGGRIRDRAVVAEAYAAVSRGRGYVLIEPFGREAEVVERAGSAPVYRALRAAGLGEWEVERVSYDDDVFLFLLYDPAVPRSYDLRCAGSPEAMLEKLRGLAESAGGSIPLQPGLAWDPAKAPHAIIAGPTGSGKSCLVNYVIAMAASEGAYLILADPKRGDLASMAGDMPEGRVAHDPAEILRQAREVVELMRRRYELMEGLRRERDDLFQADFSRYGLCPVLFVVEEVAALVAALDRHRRDEFESLIKMITLQGRQAGCGLVAVMQQPSAANIATESRSQAGLRVMLGGATRSEYRMLFGDAFVPSGTARGVGKGYCAVSGETCGPIRFEAPRLDDRQIADMMRQALSCQANIDPLACALSRSPAEGRRARPEDGAHETTTMRPCAK